MYALRFVAVAVVVVVVVVVVVIVVARVCRPVPLPALFGQQFSNSHQYLG